MEPVVSYAKERVYSTVENKLLALCAHIVNRAVFNGKDKLLLSWTQKLNGEQFSANEYWLVVQNLNKGHYDDFRNYYVSAIKTALLILPNNYYGMDFNKDNLDTSPFLTNVNYLFETYIKTVVASALIKKGIIVEKPRLNQQSLFQDGTYKLIPDLMLSNSSKVLIVGDMKYKPREMTDAKDYYQVKVYQETYGTKLAVIISPSALNAASKTELKKYYDGKLILDISLNFDDYRSAELQLIENIESLLNLRTTFN
jgi:5-methylcytosine-specific restriction endonuclease McrBC regulatory subunit McrC